MKHKQITSDTYPIYDKDIAIMLFNKGYDYKKLSKMKLENIQYACSHKGYSLQDIKLAAVTLCGYCYEFMVIDDSENPCKNCPLSICHTSESYDNIEKCTTKKEFKKIHKQWCKELGIL